jgi:hypothetical protein
MGKILKTIVMVAALVVLIVVAAPTAGFVVSLAGSLGVAAATMSAIIIAVGMTLVGAVVGMIGSKPKNLNQSQFDRLVTSVVPTAPRKIIFGKTAGGADERFHEQITQGGAILSGYPSGDYLCKVIALASHKCQSIQTVTLEDELSYSVGAVTGKFNTNHGLTLTTCVEGTHANAAAFGSGAYWKSTASFTGCAYLKIIYKLDSDIYPNSIPTRITTVVEGCPVYDPRLDSTNGGSGSHRANDQTTWAYYNGGDEIGRNPALCLLTYILGYQIGGKFAWGMGIPVSRIDFSNFIIYANICDQAVATKAGGTVKRYQCDAIFSTADTHDTVMASICAAMGTTKMVDSRGLYQLVGGYNDLASPTVAFFQSDLLAAYEWKPSPASRDHFNIVRGRFSNPLNLYQVEDYLEVSTGTLYDGIPRPFSLDLAAVSRAETCQRIAKQFLVRNQFGGMFTGVFGPSGFNVMVGSLCTMTLPQEGWNAKLFRVVSQSEATDLMFHMTLAEEDPLIYNWDSSEAQDLPAVIRPPGWDAYARESVVGLTAGTRQIANTTGGNDSYIDVYWTAPLTSVSTIQIDTKESTGTNWTSVTSGFQASAAGFTYRAPVSGLSTDIRARYRMLSGVFGPYAMTTVTAAVATVAASITGYLVDESHTFASDASGNIL